MGLGAGESLANRPFKSTATPRDPLLDKDPWQGATFDVRAKVGGRVWLRHLMRALVAIVLFWGGFGAESRKRTKADEDNRGGESTSSWAAISVTSLSRHWKELMEMQQSIICLTETCLRRGTAPRVKRLSPRSPRKQAVSRLEAFCNNYPYLDNVPEVASVELAPITAQEIVARLKKVKKFTARGPDGWSTEELRTLPLPAYQQVSMLYAAIATHGRWPQIMNEVHTTLVCKTDTSGASDLRPIGVTCILYRSLGRYPVCAPRTLDESDLW